MSRIISARPDLWNPETGLAYQDRASRPAPAQVNEVPAPDQYKPSVQQRPDGTWMLRKQISNNTYLNQIWDKTKKQLMKEWQSSASPTMAKRDYRKIIKQISALKRTAQSSDDWTFSTPVTVVSNKNGERYKDKATLTWKLDLDVRGWGVKEMSPIILPQTLKLYADVENENFETEYKEVTLLLDGENATIKRLSADSIAPSEIEVSSDGSITITF
jgi:hypothetical protein